MSKPPNRKTDKQISRRRFIAGTTAAVAALAGMAGAGAARSKSSRPRGKRLAMVIDLDRCIGCQACSIACKAEHGVRLGVFRSWVSQKESGEYPAVKRHYLPRLCNHCVNPACEKVCPTGATF
jgi:tetrathionate reductase subunit B